MNDHHRSSALKAWYDLLNQPEIRMTAEEQYEALLYLADDFEDQGIIRGDERRKLIEKATAYYSKSVEGLGQET